MAQSCPVPWATAQSHWDPPTLLSNWYALHVPVLQIGPLTYRSSSSSETHPVSYSVFRGVKLTTNPYLVPKLRMRGAIPPVFPVFMVWYLIQKSGSSAFSGAFTSLLTIYFSVFPAFYFLRSSSFLHCFTVYSCFCPSPYSCLHVSLFLISSFFISLVSLLFFMLYCFIVPSSFLSYFYLQFHSRVRFENHWLKTCFDRINTPAHAPWQLCKSVNWRVNAC